jgi:hypothetical protein
MTRPAHCPDADPIRWLAAGIDRAHAMLSRHLRQPPKVASATPLRSPLDTVSAWPTSLPSALGPSDGIRANPKSP